MNCSWAGGITVVAENEEQARDLMCGEMNYDKDTPIKRHEIKVGLVEVFYGDL